MHVLGVAGCKDKKLGLKRLQVCVGQLHDPGLQYAAWNALHRDHKDLAHNFLVPILAVTNDDEIHTLLNEGVHGSALHRHLQFTHQR